MKTNHQNETFYRTQKYIYCNNFNLLDIINLFFALLT